MSAYLLYEGYDLFCFVLKLLLHVLVCVCMCTVFLHVAVWLKPWFGDCILWVFVALFVCLFYHF